MVADAIFVLLIQKTIRHSPEPEPLKNRVLTPRIFVPIFRELVFMALV